MKSRLFKFNCIIFILFLMFFIYENIVVLYLAQSENINAIYPYHHEVFYTRIIFYELEISTYTNFTIFSVFKIIFNFIQSIGIIEILYILFSLFLFLGKEKGNKLDRMYMSVINVFLVKILLTIICFLLAFLTYTIEISIAWLIIKIIFVLSIVYYTYLVCKLINYSFD